jgi:hypothetical protein
MKLFANLLGMLGGLIGKTTSGVCAWSFFDEEEMPESLIK